jgi:hypothetical protein
MSEKSLGLKDSTKRLMDLEAGRKAPARHAPRNGYRFSV